MAGTGKGGNEPAGSIKCREFLDSLRTRQLLQKEWSGVSEQVNK